MPLLKKSPPKPKSGGNILMIPEQEIMPNPTQPRRHFDRQELANLAQSIRANGILQPVTVRTIPGGYELIAGERRLRAARLAGLTHIPCILINADDRKTALFSLLENLQRQDLSFFEEADAIQKLMRVYGLSQEEAARKLGMAQSTLSNKLRLLRLPESIRLTLEREQLTERHARTLLRLETAAQMEEALSRIIDEKLNVAQSEKLIDQLLQKPVSEKKGKKAPIKLFKDVRLFVNTLNHAVDTMKRAGISAASSRNETDEYIEYVVRIPKNGETVIRSCSDSA
ncbi:MAG: ParB/RepB/Spo0J family partition protein [Candidatus Fimivicinus sp.]|nr:ParB/RepB/Spo0J family partition protein [Oscillospiraceae bacterium]MDY5591964.1 ParB/RepB/Spo0J family partition protein [Candidatus Fimivicinus sp.]